MSDNDGVSDMLRRYAGLLGASGVAAGAFGAHALKDFLSKKPGALDNWKTAVTYQLLHATALLGVSALASNQGRLLGEEKDKPIKTGPNYSTGGNLMAIGTLMFSGSIYGLCLGVGPKKLLGPTTPIGGLLMIAGWVVIGMGS